MTYPIYKGQKFEVFHKKSLNIGYGPYGIDWK